MLECAELRGSDVSCVDTMTYFHGICSVFDYRIVVPTGVSIQTLTDWARHCGQKSILGFIYIGFRNDFVQILDLHAFTSCRHIFWWLRDFQKFWCCAFDWHADKMVGSSFTFFFSSTSPSEAFWPVMEPFWPYARGKENRWRSNDHCSCASTRTGHFWSWHAAVVNRQAGSG